MKIGIVTAWFERGAGYVSRQYRSALEAQGHEVFVLARGGEAYARGDPAWDDPHVHWARRHAFPLMTYVDSGEFRRWLLENAIEAVLFNEQVWLKPVAICRALGVKAALYVDYYTERHFDAYAIFDFLICNTRKHYTAFAWHPQCFHIPWGTDVRLFDVAGRRAPSERLRFFHSAGMNPYRKGTDLLLEAFDRAQEDPAFARETELVIHSQVPLDTGLRSRDTPRMHAALRRIEARGRLQQVQGTVGAPGLYHTGDVYAYPSRLDGIGLTVAEALAAGMPIIVPDDGPMNEFLPSAGSHAVPVARFFARSDGYYWPQNEVDVDQLASALVATAQARDRLDEHSAISRDHAVKHLNWEDRAPAISQAFETARRLEVSEDQVEAALRLHTTRFPGINRHELAYRLAYRAYLGLSGAK
jgi:glycosyltransferase involved in cell wall biosynthesis